MRSETKNSEINCRNSCGRRFQIRGPATETCDCVVTVSMTVQCIVNTGHTPMTPFRRRRPAAAAAAKAVDELNNSLRTCE